MSERTNKRTNGWMDGWTNGWMNEISGALMKLSTVFFLDIINSTGFIPSQSKSDGLCMKMTKVLK